MSPVMSMKTRVDGIVSHTLQHLEIGEFQLPLLVYFLTRMGLVSATFLRKYRRHAFVVLLVVAAIITPPDIFSLVLVILPLYGLYELSIKLASRTERNRSHEDQPEPAE